MYSNSSDRDAFALMEKRKEQEEKTRRFEMQCIIIVHAHTDALELKGEKKERKKRRWEMYCTYIIISH